MSNICLLRAPTNGYEAKQETDIFHGFREFLQAFPHYRAPWPFHSVTTSPGVVTCQRCDISKGR